jgi:hypothetical protein
VGGIQRPDADDERALQLSNGVSPSTHVSASRTTRIL